MPAGAICFTGDCRSRFSDFEEVPDAWSGSKQLVSVHSSPQTGMILSDQLTLIFCNIVIDNF